MFLFILAKVLFKTKKTLLKAFYLTCNRMPTASPVVIMTFF